VLDAYGAAWFFTMNPEFFSRNQCFPRTQTRSESPVIPVTKHQSLKISYNNGAYISYGGNYQTVSMGWQYSWIGWPK
jgi:hypothetical protein